jgi:hypothetical protein
MIVDSCDRSRAALRARRCPQWASALRAAAAAASAPGEICVRGTQEEVAPPHRRRIEINRQLPSPAVGDTRWVYSRRWRSWQQGRVVRVRGTRLLVRYGDRSEEGGVRQK